MIAYIQGKLTYIHEEAIIVDVQGVGYEIICANPFAFQDLENKDIKVYTYHHVREDAQLLYGFKNLDEKYLFTKLISVSGIGPKGAIAIMGSVHVGEFAAAIEREDEAFLTHFPGIGKKTARQIILDLKGKLTISTTVNEGQQKIDEPFDNTAVQDAKEALKALGYSENEIKATLSKLSHTGSETTDMLVRKALALLMKN
ncbi:MULTISPECIES: Holliday junction branch migration protein RuvA [Virgibacillus]|uniref:Holliday junction branch migration complex subunit RuvA n=1 Tax=Virgibacillus dokdonensis TaxID=302167 RepID=A0A2K9J2Q2_9BACI|nr:MULTISPECIES: Holliday junction branch migration protein RuvA [Virgibacillus]AUJ26146.1 Holliday junction ATP-dependent DNA helicase RuvA [Virgibacillus dokdonensis]NWO13293.1 Holliday junction branch migration protein RuvA [Virgibacillus sp.]